MTSNPPNKPPLDEFGLIARHLAPLATHPAARGLRDDVAVLGLAGLDGDLVLNTDAVVSGVHFLPDDPPAVIAERALRTNLSDLAAKGAEPVGYLLTLALPADIDEAWIADFAAGLGQNQNTFGWSLLGGDTVRTPGPLTVSVTAIGKAPAGLAPNRAGARPGDRIFVSGSIGDAALGLAVRLGQGPELPVAMQEFVIGRFRQPEPRLGLGQALAASGLITASADISDGLVADLGHIAEASGLGAVIDGKSVPVSSAGAHAIAVQADWFAQMITGGDDYELLLIAPAAAEPAMLKLASKCGVPLANVGHLEPGTGVRVTDRQGQPLALTRSGYQHF